MMTPHDEQWADCEVVLEVLGEKLRGRMRVPTRPVHVADLMPLLYSLADALVALTTRMLEARGKTVSCQAGCAACCRMPVPVSTAEAVHLARCVDAMPPEKQQALRERFERALARLDRIQILGKMTERMKAGHPHLGEELATAYAAESVTCPFLEEERCAIYADRPAVCREHMVTSPPSRCSEPGQQIERVLMPARVSPVLFRLADGVVRDRPEAIPLVQAVAWAEQRGEAAEEERLPGTELFDVFLREFSRSQLGR